MMTSFHMPSGAVMTKRKHRVEMWKRRTSYDFFLLDCAFYPSLFFSSHFFLRVVCKADYTHPRLAVVKIRFIYKNYFSDSTGSSLRIFQYKHLFRSPNRWTIKWIRRHMRHIEVILIQSYIYLNKNISNKQKQVN